MTFYIAVDGPSGAGKSTVCRAVAQELGMAYLDTGAMYRIITLAVLRAGLSSDDTAAIVKLLDETDISVSSDPNKTYFYLNGEDVTAEIRGGCDRTRICSVCSVSYTHLTLPTSDLE